ncbi:MAG: sulfotransferase [Anaerolineales bacterium]|nr:sulfotransferase [Anaerolineales bacterium]
MAKSTRNLLHKYIPQQFHDPFGLLNRLLRSKNRAAWFAVETSLLGLALTPFDLVLQIRESALYRRAAKPERPMIFVCGAPRTGTTLATQVLLNHLPVQYLNNLTAVFPRSPIVANQLFGKLAKRRVATYSSFYGKSDHFSGPNDALYLWDRWLGSNRERIRESLTAAEKSDMVRFFGAFQEAFPGPLLNKNNNLNVQAQVVAEVFENAYFVCMTRDPLHLAQSLYLARLDIHGDADFPYGIHDPDRGVTQDVVEDVCRQVLFHHKKIHEQQKAIGAERFWIVPYEQFCSQPDTLVMRAAEKILGVSVRSDDLRSSLTPFSISNQTKVDPNVFERIHSTLSRLWTESDKAAARE